MEKVFIKAVRLSENPETLVVDNKDGVGGKLNKTEDGRLFCMLQLEDGDLLRTTRRNIMYSQNDQGRWPGASPAILTQNIGASLPGQVVTKVVKEYNIGTRTVNTYSTIVLAKESVGTVFRNAGHDIVTEEYVDTATGEVIKGQPSFA